MSIRKVLIGFGAVGVVIALCLAGFGLLAMRMQRTALERVIVLEQALHNHGVADAFMESMRTDVLRALQSSAGYNKEGVAAIRADLQHHVETVTAAIASNLALPLSAELHTWTVSVADNNNSFIVNAREAVDLAFSDPLAGSRNYEYFRQNFSSLEDLMYGLRDALNDRVAKARVNGVGTANIARDVILGSALIGVLAIILNTWIAVRIAWKITVALASSRAEAHHLSLHDPLTSLPNRNRLAECVSQALVRTRRDDHAMAMLCLDLDRFKQVNDTLGHSVGDALLREVAERLRANVRDGDTVARLGGDEFAVVLARIAHSDEAGTLAQRLVQVMSEPFDLDGGRVTIGVSVGVALAPDDTAQPDELLKMADLALYRAKSDGRGTFRFFETGMDAKLQARRQLEGELRVAIAAGELELYYQPLVELASGTVSGFEALIRWPHPRRGMIPPIEFIPIAEETGLIVPLGAWVLQRACADASDWPADVSVAVNVSALQFKANGLVDAVSNALATSKLLPGRLELEITETALLNDAEATLATLRHLRTFGVRIAMDDFGTGYSSLSYLRSFPFDKIKIDQCFIRDIETSPDCKAIVRAIAGLGVNLGIATTAEGVETLAQLDQIRAEGCDLVQGYYLSRPVPKKDVAALLSTNWSRHLRPDIHEATPTTSVDLETLLS